jgi:hypothetical protein
MPSNLVKGAAMGVKLGLHMDFLDNYNWTLAGTEETERRYIGL